jgi:hypothetical protein
MGIPLLIFVAAERDVCVLLPSKLTSVSDNIPAFRLFTWPLPINGLFRHNLSLSIYIYIFVHVKYDQVNQIMRD